MLLAHISDLHINTTISHSNLEEVKTLLKYANGKNVDHLVITGDISDNSCFEDFEELRNLLDEYDFLSSERLSVVIGNHDIFGGVQKVEDIFHFPDKCKKTDYDLKVREFNAFFSEAFDKCVYRSHNNFYPYAKIIKDVLIIGINSISKYSPLKNTFASNGSVNAFQLIEVQKILSDYRDKVKYSIVLIHHHFNKMQVYSNNFAKSVWERIEKQNMKLRKKKRIINFFNRYSIDLVLHGHIHESIEYKRKGLKFLNAGASVRNELGQDLFINLINLDAGSIDCSIEPVLSPKLLRTKKSNAKKDLLLSKIENEFQSKDLVKD
jgi:3',5'-cyclic AMP phosphodiesterase CpdA